MGKKESASSLALSHHEFHLLLSQFAPVAALGWENPYTGWLTEEIQAVQKKALTSLVDRDLIRMIAKNEIALEENIAALFTACAKPDFSLFVISSKNVRSPSQTVIHCKDKLIIEHSIKKETHTLAVIPNWQELVDQLVPMLSSKATGKPSGEAFEVSEDVFAACEELVKKDKASEAKKLLKSEKLEAKSSKALIDGMLATARRSAVIVVPSKQTSAAVIKTGMAVYETSKQTWLLRPFERAGKQFIEFNPANSALIAKEVQQLRPIGL